MKLSSDSAKLKPPAAERRLQAAEVSMFHGALIPFRLIELPTCPNCGDILTADEELDGICVACELALYYEEREDRSWPHEFEPRCDCCIGREYPEPDSEEQPPF